MEKEDRLRVLLEIVIGGRYRKQDELVEALEAKGVSVTQSSVSRDIRDLGLRKHGGFYVAPPEMLAGPSGPDMWAFAMSVVCAGDNMVVIHSKPATAQTLAIELDSVDWPGIVGTIAGDDTIFVAVSDASACRDIVRRLRFIAGLD
jgi:transcriptional regulator of arginine metabolism